MSSRDHNTATSDNKALMEPNVCLYGPIDDDAVKNCLKQLEEVRRSGNPLVLELTTEGGDAEGGRRIALEIRLFRQFVGGETFFIGKTVVMSAGATIMAAFPSTHRYLTEDTLVLIHERRLQKSLDLNGPIKANLQIVRSMLAQLESAEQIERAGFGELAQGSKLTGEEMYQRATENFYLTAPQALDLGLIAGVI